MTAFPLPPSWREPLRDVLTSAPVAALRAFLAREEAADKHIFPPAADRFRALELTAPGDVRVVILGQDPYHGAGQAHGLAFSVQPGVRPPPSLVNIFKEMKTDLGIDPPGHGHLEPWARQGVLLLNTVLTVESGRAASHRARGWEALTDAIVRVIADGDAPTVFMLWGRPAQAKAVFVRDVTVGGHHLVLRAPHPSPLSAHTGWFGSRPFSQANAFLAAHGRGTIDWALPPP